MSTRGGGKTEGAVVIDCLEYLMIYNHEEGFLKLISKVRDFVVLSGGTLIPVVDPESVGGGSWLILRGSSLEYHNLLYRSSNSLMPPREDPGENEPGGDAGATARPYSEVPTGGPSALRSTMTVGNPGRAQFWPAWVNPPEFCRWLQ